MKSRIYHPANPAGSPLMSGAIDLGDWIVISGQGPLQAGKYIQGTIEQETTMTLEHIETLLSQTGLDRSAIVKCTCWLSDLSYFDGFNDAYGAFFATVDIPPTRSTVGSPLLRGIKVEIEAMARRS